MFLRNSVTAKVKQILKIILFLILPLNWQTLYAIIDDSGFWKIQVIRAVGLNGALINRPPPPHPPSCLN